MDQAAISARLSKFGKRLVSLEEASLLIQRRHVVVAAMAAAEPYGLFSILDRIAMRAAPITVYCANPSEPFACFSDPGLVGKLDLRVMFLTAAIRKFHGHGAVSYVPQHLSRWVANLQHRSAVDVFWGTCSLPDERGFVSLGVNACYEPEVLRSANCVILEVNPHMPVSFGSTHVPIASVDAFVLGNRKLPTVPPAPADDVDAQIAEHVASLVPDGATLQLGIGSIPNAIGKALSTKKNLGVHTEMINDAMLELYQAGVITGAKKTIWPGKMIGAFAFGTDKLYQFINNNPLVELHPASVVNDPHRIARNHRMMSINTAVEVDLTGQVCSESVGHTELSGVGGAADTHVGAQRAVGGRGIVALRSKAGKGGSKIVFELQPGAKVSITRNDVDTIVTEYGIAELTGRTVAERIRALVALAHPEYRDVLMQQAKTAGYL